MGSPKPLKRIPTEEALKQREHELSALLDATQDQAFLIKPDGTLLVVNQKFVDVSGADAKALLGRKCYDLVAPEVAAVRKQRIQQLLSSNKTLRFEDQIEDRYFEHTLYPVFGDHKEIEQVAVFFRDVTPQRQAMEALRESEGKFRGFFDLSPQGIAISEAATGRLLEVNDVFCEQLQYSREELLGRTTLELALFSEEERRHFVQTLRQDGSVHGLEMDFRSKDGSLRHSLVSARIIPVGDFPVILTVIVDLTQRQQLEIQLRQSQKMEAIGNLAGGVAHDMNNILAAIMGLASVLQVDVESDSAMMEDIKGILTACRRGSDLTHNLLGFARKGKYRKEPISLNGVITKVQELLQRTIPKGIVLRADLESQLAGVEGDPVQINQVLVNLAINAVDAMGDKGTLTFRTSTVTLTEAGEHQVAGLSPGRYIVCEVIDTGAGMDEDTCQHAFEPFFTTKATGEGTGLGLSMVYGTIKNHGGQVVLRSRPGQGAAFTLYLPSLGTSAADRESSDTWAQVSPQYGGTILLVDDEELVRTSGRRLLEKLGYKVLLAENGQVALSTYEAHQQEIVLVILDLIMPVMNGVETCEGLKARDSQVRVLLSSGYSRQKITDQLFSLGASGFLQKPYTLKRLSEEVSRALQPEGEASV